MIPWTRLYIQGDKKFQLLKVDKNKNRSTHHFWCKYQKLEPPEHIASINKLQKKMEKQETNCLRFVEIQTETCPKYVWTVSLCVKLFFCTFHFQRRKTCLFFVKTFHLAILNFYLNKQNFRSGLSRQKANICHKHKKMFAQTVKRSKTVVPMNHKKLENSPWPWRLSQNVTNSDYFCRFQKFECDTCPSFFYRKSDLASHVRKVHLKTNRLNCSGQ